MTKQRLTASSDFMQNYVAGKVVSPPAQFEAVHTSDGHAVLFRLDASGTLDAIEEQSGTLHTGWQVHPLSSAAELEKLPGVTIRAFNATHHVVDDSIGLIMVASRDAGHDDHLLVSLGNSRQDMSWLADPRWSHVPFEPQDGDSSRVSIVRTMFTEPSGANHVIIVDVQLDSKDPGNTRIDRYHVHIGAHGRGARWVKRGMEGGIPAGQYQSVVGRAGGEKTDGIYTAVSGQPQLLYESIDARDESTASGIQLFMPGPKGPEAISVVRNEDGSTDLYAVSGSTLYQSSTREQAGGIQLMPVLSSEYLVGTETLQTVRQGRSIVLWGKNSRKELFYAVSIAGTWNVPTLISTGVEHASPYVSSVDGAITIFTSKDDQLHKLIQGSKYTDRVWNAQDIHIATSSPATSTAIKSYTTNLNTTQEDGSPAINVDVTLSANTRTPVYINGIYYVLSSTPTKVVTDAVGSLTIVEPTKSLCSASMKASLGDSALVINPKDTAFTKLAGLKSVDQLRVATVPAITTAGGVLDAETTTLVHPTIDDEHLEQVTQQMHILEKAYEELHSKNEGQEDVQGYLLKRPSDTLAEEPASVNWFDDFVQDVSGPDDTSSGQVSGFDYISIISNPLDPSSYGTSNIDFGDLFHKMGDGIRGAFHKAGDLLETLKNKIAGGAKNIMAAIGRAADGTYRLIVKIGGVVHQAYLKSQEALIRALEIIWDGIKSSTAAVFNFVESLVSWKNVSRTKDIVQGIMMTWLQKEVASIQDVKTHLDSAIKKVKSDVESWGHIEGLGQSVPELNGETMTAGPSPFTHMSSPALLMFNAFRDHGKDAKLQSVPEASNAGQVLSVLAAAVYNEGAVLETSYHKLKALAVDIRSKSSQDILQGIIAVLTDSLLSSSQVVMDALLDVLQQASETVLDFLNSKIHIPVISDILGLVGVREFSIMDLFAWMGALAMTVTWEINRGRVPFAGQGGGSSASYQTTDEVGLILSEADGAGGAGSSDSFPIPKSFDDLMAYMSGKSTPDSMKREVYELSFLLSGAFRLGGAVFQGIEAETESTGYGVLSGTIGLCSASCNGAGKILTPLKPIKSGLFSKHSTIVTTISILTKVYFSGPASWTLGKVNAGALVLDNRRSFGAMIDTALAVHAAVDTVWHFHELFEGPAGAARSAALWDEGSNLADYLARILYMAAVNDPDRESRLVIIGAMSVANVGYAGLKVRQVEAGAQAFA